MHRANNGLKKTTQQKKSLHKQSPLKQQKRNIISYRTNPNDPAKQRRRAKNQMKKGEKPGLVFHTPNVALVGTTQQTLADGKVVDIFKQVSSTTRRFGPAFHKKHPHSHLEVDNASDFIHKIATRVAQAKPIVIAESSLKDINNQYISNTQAFTADDYRSNMKTNHILRLTPPPFMKAGMFRRRAVANSKNQQKRWDALISQRAVAIKQKKADFAAQIQQLASYQPFDGDFKSTPEAPIDFSNDMGLKFRIIDAVIKQTKIQVPSSMLSSINNVTQLVQFVVEKRKELIAKGEIRRNKEHLPANVTYIYTGKIDRSKRPTWEKYAAARQKSAVASADV